MAIYLSRKKGGTVATPITPSNSSPAQMTADTPVNPTGNGYAIQSYDSVTPSSTPTSVSSGDIVKFGGSGVIVDSVPTPTSLTPSNSTPATITSGATYTATTGGKAIASYSEVAPSNANPPEIYNGGIYKIKTRNGYLISTINIVVPSDSNPPLLSNDNSWYRLNGASGYLYSTVQPKVSTGTFTRTTSSTTTINCGFTPDMIILMKGSGTTTTVSTGDFRAIYWKDWSTSYMVDDYRSSSGYYLKNEPVSDFLTFTSTGFTYAKASSSTYAGTVKYIAVKYS